MKNYEEQYIDLVKKILNEGVEVENRTGTNTIKIPFTNFEIDLEKEFPILQSKFVAIKSATIEMLWFYQEQSNDVRWLTDRNVKIWNEWKIDEDGIYRIRDQDGNITYEKAFGKEYAHTIGEAYGFIVKEYDLINKLIDKLKNNKEDRRMIMSLWQDKHLEKAVLPSCVWNSMWDVTDGKLNAIVTQRSCDVALGLPFNISQYAVLQSVLAKVTGLKVGKLYFNIKDAHIYVNQIDGVKEQLAEYEKMPEKKILPQLKLREDLKDFYDFKYEDMTITNYTPGKKIKMPVSI